MTIMRVLLIILLSVVLLPINAQGNYSYTLKYNNTDLRVLVSLSKDGKTISKYGLYQYGRKILPVKYQLEYNGMLDLYVFYNSKEVRVFSSVTAREIKSYIAPKSIKIESAFFIALNSYTYEIRVKTSKNEKLLGTYVYLKGNIYELPRNNRTLIH